jgi:hypothetical protein
MDPHSSRFLATFNIIEDWMRQELDANEEEDFGSLIRRMERKNSEVRRHSPELKRLARLRNLIAQSRRIAVRRNAMNASAWNGGASAYGIRVGIPNRDQYFDQSWDEIEVEIEGEVHRFALTAGFWKNCPEFRDRGRSIIRDWLRRHHTIDWARGEPPQVQLTPLGGNRFRLE